MVSALWKACAAEVQDADEVQRLLGEGGVDLEIKDQAATTPLIQAVKNGHKDVVKALLAAGADPNNSSNQGRPETYTTDPEMLALLQPKQHPSQPLPEGFQPPQDPNAPYNPAMHPYYYPAPPGHEGPYPPYPYPMLSPPDGQPPVPGFPPATDGNSPGGVPNLPPADIARTIPCRYFPVCRYGSSCMFLHPQPPAGAPFTPGPIPAPYGYPRPYLDTPKDAVPNGTVANGTGEESQPSPVTNGINGITGTGNHPNGGFGRRPPRGGRRESFGAGRQPKPACLFFPSGRCRNGDDCRFPHILPEPGSQPTSFRYPNSNGNNNGRYNNNHRSRPSVSHHDGPPPAHIPPGTKLPFAPNGHVAPEQRVPNADDFPVLRAPGTGADRSPASGPAVNGMNGMTAAQVLQAPPPVKKGKVESEAVSDLADAFSKVGQTHSMFFITRTEWFLRSTSTGSRLLLSMLPPPRPRSPPSEHNQLQERGGRCLYLVT
ncbi:hypothetical protein FRC08_010518 [Ceratobasidium sp. 394]|nr:hypothetical protein FRC08_010518 [Ceratobasidium sp. 394]